MGGALLFWIVWKLIHEGGKGSTGGDLILLAVGFAAMITLVILVDTLVDTLLTSRLNRFVCTGAGLLIYLAVEMLFAEVFLYEYLEP